MSYKATSWVLDHSESTLAARLVLLTLAEYAHDDGSNAFPSVETICQKARVAERTARYALRTLEGLKEIERQGIHASGTTIWRVTMGEPKGEAKSAGGQDSAQNVARSAPDPLVEPPTLSENSNSVVAPIENSNASELGVERQLSKVSEAQGTLMPISENGGGHENGNGHRPVKFDRQVVPPEVLRRAEAALAVFNECAGRRLRPYTARGEKSDALGRILGKLLDHPEVPDAQLHQAIRNVFSNPPKWLNGDPPDVGDIFGRNSFRRALANDGVRREQERLTAGEQAEVRRRERMERRYAAALAEDAGVVNGTATEVRA